eukprot:g13692.t2
MWPPTADGTREGEPGGIIASEGRKNKRRNKKRCTSDRSSPAPSSGEQHEKEDGAEGTPARPRAGEQLKGSGVVASAAGGGSELLAGVTARARRDSEDASGQIAVGGAANISRSATAVGLAGQDGAGAAMDDNGDDEDDEGVVIQRERPPTTPPTHATDNKNKKKIKKQKKKKSEEPPSAAATGNGQDDGGGSVAEEGTPQKKKNKKRRKESQDANGDESGQPSSGIPFALQPQGARIPKHLKPSGRSRSASIESAAEFFSSSKTHRPGDPRDDLNTVAATVEKNADAGASISGSDSASVSGDAGGLSNGESARKRQRDEAGGGGSGGGGGGGVARLGGAVKGRVPRKHQEQRRGLPIFAHKANIIRAVKDHQTVVVVGETGSGKSTQIPQFLYEAGITGGGPGWGAGGRQGGAPSQAAAALPAAANGGGKGRGRASSQEDMSKSSNGARGDGAKGGGLLVACTQPRRVAAVTVAKRVASEVGCELGHVVGYTVRFDDRTSKSTRIKYMTDGVLLREAMSDPLLSAYSAIVLDEAHERSLDTDILFGLVRRLQPKRPELKVIVMSATLDVDLFRSFFRDSVSLYVPGRTHPVDVMYATEDQDDYLDACLVTCLQIHEEEKGDGDVLVFLPGQDDIEALSQLLRENLAKLRAEKSRELAAASAEAAAAAGEDEFRQPGGGGGGDLQGAGDGLLRESMVCPVFAALPQEQQLEAFEPAPKGTRKFVLATNIAETSITINGIRFVVDSGKVKVRSFQPSTGMEFLRSKDVSKAQATQRAGRAGREAPGVCYRLFREDSYLELGDAPTPEILRVNLAQIVLQLKVMGIEDPSTFDYVTAPSRAALLKALGTLAMLRALDKSGRITAVGKRMAALPLDPAFAHLLIRSAEPRFSCVKEILTTVACLSAENLLFYPPKEEARREADDAHRAFAAYEGDLPTLLRVYEAFLKDITWCRRNFVNGRSVARAIDVRQQLAKILRERLRIDPEESCEAEMSQYLRCLVAGLFTNVALRQPSTSGGGGRSCYRTVIGGREAQIHPSSSLWRRNPPAKCVVFTELLSTSRDFIKTVTAVDASWLRELVPQYFKSSGAVGASS